MPPHANRSDSDALERLQLSVDACLARDIPRLEKQLRALRARCARQQPIADGLHKLQSAIERSRAAVQSRVVHAPRPEYPPGLPVVDKRELILNAVRENPVVVLCGETGSGKTTQLPKICLEAGLGVRGRIGHTQPRRIAARTLAARIAEELGSEPGQQVGFKVRYQDQVQESSYIKVMTDGILLAEIRSDPELREYDALIIDEAHERSLNIDFLLGYLHRLLPRRPDLKIIITSATIDPVRFSRHFGDAPVIEVTGRTYPVEIRYRPLAGDDDDQQDRSRGQAILDAVDELAGHGPGDVLVFLPGERAIRETGEQLRKHHPPHTEILPLYARLTAAQQSQVFRPHKGRRIVLATNVAETSLTVPGIHYVVDTGLARVSRYSYRSKVQRLPIEAVSQASANQRAGRCGRVASGVCIRLYSEADYDSRPAFTEPEIQRTSLAAVILQMAALGLGDIEAFPFVDAPDARFVRDGYKLLFELGAVNERRKLTPLGRRIARLPIDPRLARMVLAAGEMHCLAEVLVIVSALEVVDPRDRPLEHAQAADQKHALFADPRSDFLAYVNLWNAFTEQSRHLSQNKLRKWCREHFLSYMRMREWLDLYRQLLASVKGMGMQLNTAEADYRAVHCALMTGLLGNLAFQSDSGEYTGARNQKFVLFPGSGLRRKQPKWLMAAELVETGRRYLRTVASIDPAWVEDLAGHLVKRSYSEPHWEKKRGRVAAFERVTLYGLPLVARRRVNYGPIDPQAARGLFIRHALVAGEFVTHAEFARRNRALLDELDQLESKSRRRDVLVDEEELFAFFDQRIPETVYDGPGFQHWWKKAGRSQPQLLDLQRDAIMRHDAGGVTGEQYPDSLEIRGMRLPVSYHFSPGAADDGVNVTLPLAALNQVQAQDFDWLVPGFVKEKITLLIKSLPKALRRHFVPAPDFADACLQRLSGPRAALTDTLGDQLRQITGVTVPADAWRPELLPDHLSVYFRLVDERGRELDAGRDLSRLKARYAASAQRDFSQVQDTSYQRSDIRDWNFGELPAFIELQQGGLTVRGYPALSVTDGRVDLRLFDQPGEAAVAQREGLLSLFRLKAGRLVKEIGRNVPELKRQELWFSPVAGAGALLEDIERAVLQAVFLPGGADVRDAQAFNRRLEQGRARVVECAAHIGRCTFDALEAYHEISSRMKKNLAPQLLSAVAEIRDQVDGLVYPGFVAGTPLQWLPQLGRYLRAAAIRLEKLPGNIDKDRKQAATVRRYLEKYRGLQQAGVESAMLVELRWSIEELRVSLFAQTLGTAVKVSPERLDRQIAALR